MTTRQKLESIHEGIELSSPEELHKAVKIICEAEELSGAAKDVLNCLYKHGPCEDGDVPSKTGRDELLHAEFASKVIVKGNDGYQALNYRGRDAHHVIFGTEK